MNIEGDWNETTFVPGWKMKVSYKCGLGRRFDYASPSRQLEEVYKCWRKEVAANNEF